jgi:hypothetical protein
VDPTAGQRLLDAASNSSVRVVSGNRDDASCFRDGIPPRQRRVRPIEEHRKGTGRTDRIRRNGARQWQAAFIPPLAVSVQPLDPVHRRRPVAPGELLTKGTRMRRDAEAAEPRDILHDRRAVASERVRRRGRSQRDVVTARRADFNAVEAQHAEEVFGGIRRSGSVSVIGKDDELEPGCAGGGRDTRFVAGAIGSGRVDVKGAANRAPRQRRIRSSNGPRGGWKRREDKCGQREDRQPCNDQRPADDGDRSVPYRASALSALALSVRSQVNSGSLRPKWPNAAVFL